jgi:hypothetical protein
VLLFCSWAVQATAHEVRPAYLELREASDGVVDVVFKQPARGNRGLRLEPSLPSHCLIRGREIAAVGGTAFIERLRADCGKRGLRGSRIEIEGLSATLTDVAVLIELRDGGRLRALLRPEAPGLLVSEAANHGLAGYFRLGVDHLVFGFDHVLFVLCLLFFLTRLVPLVQTITAFTLAHSITLGISALGWVRLPQGPVEAVIALSILLLAVEKLRGSPTSLTARRPWLVAFAFGLLHGFGFAGALAEIGLPEGDALVALLLFNLGVEAGQLAIVAAAGLCVALIARVPIPEQALRGFPRVALYAIGSLGSWWWIDRTLAILGTG